MAFKLEEAPFELNLADKLDQPTLDEIGQDLIRQIEIDDDSRQEWMETNRDWLRLAAQVRETKSFPWPGASNVKFPLLTIASMQFHARALPNLINSNLPVRARTIGKDPQGEKRMRANRVSQYLSYEILEGMDEWMDEMDRLLFVLPMLGIVYKKTFYSDAQEKVKSVMVLPNDLIVNYHAQSFERARMTQVLYLDTNEIHELQMAGIFSDVELSEPREEEYDMDRNARDDINLINNPMDSDLTPYELYESHCWLDLDEDGYKEPYIVTLTKDRKVLRIVARWGEDNVFYNDAGKIIRIVPDEYFTPYIFLPDPSSSVSGLGLGALLGPVNESVNTLINQLIDAGTLSTLQTGFIGRGLKLRGGATRFRPGEWKIVNTTGEDISKNIYPLPIKEPSATLFQLLDLLIISGERVASVSEMMVGENPGQNQPATTTMAVLEQGLQVYTSIYKRVHRQLGKEYLKLYKLNGIYLDEDRYNMILDENLEQPNAFFTIEDFKIDDMDIRPASDPAIVSQAQKSVKAQALMEKLALGLPLNVGEVTKRVLEAEDQENIAALMNVQPQPNPEVELENMKFQHQQQMDQAQLQLDALKIRAQAVKDETGAQLNVAKSQEIGANAQRQDIQQEIDAIQNEAKLAIEELKAKKPEKTSNASSK